MVHPGTVGEEKMAQKWFEAIDAYLTTTRIKHDISFHTSGSSAKKHVDYPGELVFPRISPERYAPLGNAGFVIDFLGKKVSAAGGDGNRTNGVYIAPGTNGGCSRE